MFCSVACRGNALIPTRIVPNPEKRCLMCLDTKPVGSFYPNPQNRGGYDLKCKACRAQQTRMRPHKRKVTDPVQLWKNSVRSKTRYAIKVGRLVKEPCQDCGQSEVQAHHPDYSKPFDIVWLCVIHHKDRHRRSQLALYLPSRPDPHAACMTECGSACTRTTHA